MHPRQIVSLHQAVVVALLIGIAACMASDSPVSSPTDLPMTSPRDSAASSVLWGLWDVALNTETMELEVTPVRGAAFRANLNNFLQPPTGSTDSMHLSLVDVSTLFVNGECSVDVSLKHPFPGFNSYTGFDVRGVFIHNGSRTAKYSTLLRFADQDSTSDAVLLNADGYTRWFNPQEFQQSGLLGYTEGTLGTHDVYWTARLNPFKTFADGLHRTRDLTEWLHYPVNIQGRCMFTPGYTNSRRYELRFPLVQGMPRVKFQYAVTASWEKSAPDPPVLIPGDFPPEANLQEAYCISVLDAGSTLWFKPIQEEKDGFPDPNISGGDLKLYVEVFDHQAVGREVTYEIARLGITSMTSLIPTEYNTVWYSPEELETMEIDSRGTDGSTVYLIEIKDLKPASLNSEEVLITVESDSPTTYDQGLGAPAPSDPPLAAYALYAQHVKTQIPCPDTIQYSAGPQINESSLDNPQYAGERSLGIRGNWLFAVWCRNTIGNGRDVFFSRSWNNGQDWSEPVVVNADGGSGDQTSPCIAVPESGSIYIAYCDGGYDPPRIIVCRSDNLGTAWTGHNTVHDNTPEDDEWGNYPVLSVDDTHMVHCLWIDNRYGYPAVYHARGQSGSLWSENIRVSDSTWGIEVNPDAVDIFVDVWGGVHAVWSDLRDEIFGSGTTIYYDYSIDGSDWGDDVRVDHDNSGDYESISPSVCVDTAAEVHVVWADTRASSGAFPHLYYTRSEDNGLSFPMEVRVFHDTAITSPEGMLGPGGVPYLVFQANYGYLDQHVEFMYTCDGGDDFIGPITILTNSRSVASPCGVVGDDGSIYVTYIEQTLNPISVDLYLATGTPVFPE